MSKLYLDFSNSKQLRRQQSNLVVIVVLILLIIGVVIEYTRIDNRMREIEDSLAKIQEHKPVKRTKLTKQDLQKMKAASEVQTKLNFPWNELLAAIETVKQQARTISLIAIQPKPANKELQLKAEAPDLKTMLKFVKLLEKQPVLENVLVMNQSRLAPTKNKHLAFTLKIRWII